MGRASAAIWSRRDVHTNTTGGRYYCARPARYQRNIRCMMSCRWPGRVYAAVLMKVPTANSSFINRAQWVTAFLASRPSRVGAELSLNTVAVDFVPRLALYPRSLIARQKPSQLAIAGRDGVSDRPRPRTHGIVRGRSRRPSASTAQRRRRPRVAAQSTVSASSFITGRLRRNRCRSAAHQPAFLDGQRVHHL